MAKKVKHDDKIHVFPDDATPEQIAEALGVQYTPPGGKISDTNENWARWETYAGDYLQGLGVGVKAATQAAKAFAKDLASGTSLLEASRRHLGVGGEAPTYGSTFTQAYDSYRGDRNKSIEENPMDMIGGIIASLPVNMAGTGAIAQGGINLLAKGAPTAARVLSGTGTGMAGLGSKVASGGYQGAISAAIGANLTDASLGEDLLMGTALGGALPLAFSAGKKLYEGGKYLGGGWQDKLTQNLLMKAGVGAGPLPGNDKVLPGIQLTLGQLLDNNNLLKAEQSIALRDPQAKALADGAKQANVDTLVGTAGELGAAPTAEAGRGIQEALGKTLPDTNEVGGTLRSALGVGERGFYDAKAGAKEIIENEAAPELRASFVANSIAPLETQLQNSWGELVEAERAAQKRIAELDQKLMLASKRNDPSVGPNANNVYLGHADSAGAAAKGGGPEVLPGQTGAVVEQRRIIGELEQAREELAIVQANKAEALGMLRQAQTDGTAGSREGLWSPALSRMLTNPRVKEGLSRGVAMLRDEADARGLPPQFMDWASVIDEAGNLVPGRVPNMQLLDAGRRGMDAMLEAARDPVTGKLVLTPELRAVAELRSAFTNEIKRLNPEYAEALAKYADSRSYNNALDMGRGVFDGRDAELSADFVAGLTPKEQEAYRIGVVRAVEERVKDAVSPAKAVDQILTEGNLERLRSAFPDDDVFGDVVNRLQKFRSAPKEFESVLAQNADGTFSMRPEDVYREIVKPNSPTLLTQYVSRLGSLPDDAKAAGVQALRSGFITQMMGDAMQSVGGQLTFKYPDKFVKDFGYVLKNPDIFPPELADLTARWLASVQKLAAKPVGTQSPQAAQLAEYFNAPLLEAMMGKAQARWASRIAGGAAAAGVASMVAAGKVPWYMAELVGGSLGALGGNKLQDMVFSGPQFEIQGALRNALFAPQAGSALIPPPAAQPMAFKPNPLIPAGVTAGNALIQR